LGFSNETINLVHLVHSSSSPTFLCYHGLDLSAKGLDIFRMG
jgi:hypothetical protein